MRSIVGGSIVGVKLILSNMDIKEKFGHKVKELRENKGFSIEQLANISNVDRNYISDIEKGKRNVSIEIMEKIVLALDADFIEFSNDNNFKKRKDYLMNLKLIVKSNNNQLVDMLFDSILCSSDIIIFFKS